MSEQQALLPDAPTEAGGVHDFWPTPRYVIEAILPVVQERLDLGRRGRPDVLDPGCGDGAILEAVYDGVECCSLYGCEIEPRRAVQARDRLRHVAAVEQRDFLDPAFVAQWVERHGTDRPTLVVANPPYSEPRETIGLEFVEQMIRCAEPSKGVVASLLPLDYACGKKRVERLHAKWQSALYPLKNRPKFANGQTGKRPVAWFVWDLLNPYSLWSPLTV